MHARREKLTGLIEDLVYETTLIQWGVIAAWSRHPWMYALISIIALLMLWLFFYAAYFSLILVWIVTHIAFDD